MSQGYGAACICRERYKILLFRRCSGRTAVPQIPGVYVCATGCRVYARDRVPSLSEKLRVTAEGVEFDDK